MKTQILVQMMYESGKPLMHISKELSIDPKKVALLYAEAEAARDRYKRKEKVVYRKRLSNLGVKSRHKKLVEMMETL